MIIDFRIDFGYQYLYSRRHYHPTYLWDGNLSCNSGVIKECYLLDYPYTWYGMGQSARETRLTEPRWSIKTKRGFAGVRFVADVAGNAEFELKTLSGSFTFTAGEIISQGRIEFPVGPKYLGCHIIVTKTGYYWFRSPLKNGQRVIEAKDLCVSVPVRNWSRMEVGWIDPGKEAVFELDVPKSKLEFSEQLFHIVCMTAPGYTPEKEQPAFGYIPVELYCDNELVAKNKRFYRMHDAYMQLLEDLWLRCRVAPGKHTFKLRNCHCKLSFLINRIIFQNSEHFHGELSLPEWALTGEKQIGKVFAVTKDTVTLNVEDEKITLAVVPGWNEFEFTLNKSTVDCLITTNLSTSGKVKAVYNLPDETPEVMVGYDMTTVPHDDSGTMDWLLDYTYRTKLGNIVVFRSFLYNNLSDDAWVERLSEVNDDLLKKWGDFCRTHHIYVEAATDFDSGALVAGAGDMLHSVGRHEWPGAVYAFDPQEEWKSGDMREAMNNCIRRLKIEVDRAHKVAPRAAFGDASGGHRYCYMAGADFIRSETMVPHTQHLCSQARPAAEVFRNGEWGVHIAIQHPFQPYFENHLGQYFLSLYQPWMMGANMIYEEDSLFNLFKEERQCWDDLLCKGKRDMTRDFYRFAKTHPRSGRVIRKIAFVEGRYAAPFNGFICDVEQDPDYSVWGLFGNNSPEWGHRQPEKCRQLLDVLMPGASTLPLRQDFNKRRFFFSGTPYGDFDEVPTEASAEYLEQYSLLLHLGWNTMIGEDLEKLQNFVFKGGTLLIGLAQFSTHVKRDFLRDMNDLALWNRGDLSEFCGVKVKGAGFPYCGNWNCENRDKFPVVELSGIPSNNPDEDGVCRLAEIELCGAEPVIWDSATGKPMVVRFNYGKGAVYLLTMYAYFGHEALRPVMAGLIAELCSKNLPDCTVDDPSRELFWNEWIEPNGLKRLMLLNTDWSKAGNTREVAVKTPKITFKTQVTEREPKILVINDDMAIEQPPEFFITKNGNGELEVHGTGSTQLVVHRQYGITEYKPVSLTGNTVTLLN